MATKKATTAQEMELGPKTRQQLEIRLGQIVKSIDAQSNNIGKWLARLADNKAAAKKSAKR